MMFQAIVSGNKSQEDRAFEGTSQKHDKESSLELGTWKPKNGFKKTKRYKWKKKEIKTVLSPFVTLSAEETSSSSKIVPI